MVEFNLWRESFIFASVYSFIIIVPCILVAILGKKMINQLGNYPTQTPYIQLDIVLQLIIIEIVTFTLLIGFLQFFSET